MTEITINSDSESSSLRSTIVPEQNSKTLHNKIVGNNIFPSSFDLKDEVKRVQAKNLPSRRHRGVTKQGVSFTRPPGHKDTLDIYTPDPISRKLLQSMQNDGCNVFITKENKHQMKTQPDLYQSKMNENQPVLFYAYNVPKSNNLPGGFNYLLNSTDQHLKLSNGQRIK